YLTGVGDIDGFYNQKTSVIGATNIFTFLRGVLNDFGFVFSNVIFFVLGAYMYKVSVVKTTKISYSAFSVVFCIFLFPFISPFSYTTFLVAFCLSLVVLVRRPVNA
ncbi:hypothetical protein N9A71_05265, partial [Porticoccaceae bacterium]|nr:hypothetical protein [Porticoccaceae bacterium]